MAKFCCAKFLSQELIPRIEASIEAGTPLLLNHKDCENLLFILRTSIHLEPFIEAVAEMVRNTYADWKKDDR